VPVIESPITLSTLLETVKSEQARVMFAERSGDRLLEAMEKTRPQSLIALVGPEGGWDVDEIEQARNTGWQIVTALLQHLFGDLR
jgi:16S rRNA U1498 N3-methylase RsmE